MSKILELPKFKPVICLVCGCKYEFEEGDKFQPILLSPAVYINGNRIQGEIFSLKLSCPLCGQPNNIEFEVEVEE